MVIEVVLGLLVVVALGGGYWFGKRQLVPPVARGVDNADDHSLAYAERFRSFGQWRESLAHFHAQMHQPASVAEMSALFATTLRGEFPDAHILVAIGPIKDIMLLQTLATMNKQHIELNDLSCIVTRPEITADLANELAHELYDLAKKQQSASRRWWLLREIAPALQSHLSHRFHFNGQGLLVPLYCGEILCGVMLISGKHLEKGVDLVRDNGEFATMAGDVMTTWVRCMAPHIMAGTAADPLSVMPMHAMASLNLLEQSAEMVQSQAENHEILEELADYSRSITTPSAEISLLAAQTCESMRRICQADFVMFLRPTSFDTEPTFMVEGIEADTWAWSRYKGYQRRPGGAERVPFKERALNAWTDALVRDVYLQSHTVSAKTEGEINKIAPSLLDAGLALSSLVAIPALIRGHCAAIIIAGRKQTGGISEQSTMLATAVTALAGMRLSAMYLMQQQHSLQESNEAVWKLASTLTTQGIETLTNIVKKWSILTYSNYQELARYAEAIACQMGLAPTELSNIRMAALMCDLGSIVIPLSILRKEGGLTDDEWRLIQNHPKITVELLGKFDVFRGALPFILHHHERYNGTGYPQQLAKEQIPLGARIIAVADAFVNMQMKRPYRDPLSREEALTTLRQDAGAQFDPGVVRALMRVIVAENTAKEAVA